MGLLTVFRRDGSELAREFRRGSLTVLFYRIECSDDPEVTVCNPSVRVFRCLYLTFFGWRP